MNFSKMIYDGITSNRMTIYRLSKLAGLPESTIRSYLNGISPSVEKADILLNALNASMIIGKRIEAERESPVPLTVEQLREMDGEPVWIKSEGFDEAEIECGIVDIAGGYILTGSKASYPTNECGETFYAYAHKPGGEAAP